MHLAGVDIANERFELYWFGRSIGVRRPSG